MQVGSLVECIKEFDNSFMLELLQIITGKSFRFPVKGETYIVEEISLCSCGEHNNLRLDSIPEDTWPESHFRELQPPINLEKILENVDQESLEEVYS